MVVYAAHLGEFDGLGFGVVLVSARDEGAEEDIKLCSGVSVHCSSNGPHQREEKQTLQPQCALREDERRRKERERRRRRRGHSRCCVVEGVWCIYLRLWNGGVSLVSCDGSVQQAGVEVEEGVYQVEGGGCEEQPTVVLDKVQAGLYQPVKQISDKLLLVLKHLAKVVPPSFLHCIRH